MGQILRLGLHDLRLTVKDRFAFFWMLAFPIILMWMMSNVGGGGGPQRIGLDVEDRDGGWLAEALVEELEDETIALNVVRPAAAGADTAGAAAADAEPEPERTRRTLVIPEGFTEGVLAGEPRELVVYPVAGSDPSFDLAAQAHVFRTIGRTLARLIEMDEAGDAASLERFRALGERAPLVTLDVTTAGEGVRVPSGSAQSVPGTLTMTVLMMTVIYGAVFLVMEKRTGALKRQATLPVSRGQIILGKLAGRFGVAALQIVLLLLAGRFLFGVSWGNSPVGLAMVLVAYAASVTGLATLLGAVTTSAEQASAIGWIGTMVMAGLGGCWWPGELMPAWLWTAAHALPTAWAMDAFHSLISFGRGASAVALPSAVLLGFGAVFSILGARLIRFD